MILLSRFTLSSSGLLVVSSLIAGLGILRVDGDSIRREAAGPLPVFWPIARAIERDRVRSTRLVLLRSRLPCSWVGIAELIGTVRKFEGRVTPRALLLHSTVPPGEWGHSVFEDPLAAALQFPARPDSQGREPRRFSGQTSGYIALYGTEGRLTECGPFTAARGHHGAAYGQACVIDLILSMRQLQSWLRVFGSPPVESQRAVDKDQGP